MTFSLIDYIVVIVYIIIILYTGFILSKRESRKRVKYRRIFACRKEINPSIVRFYSCRHMVRQHPWCGRICLYQRHGSMGLFRSSVLFCGWSFCWFLAKRIRNFNVRTIPEQIILKYGLTAGWLSSLIVLIISIPAVYILILGVLVQLFTGWDLWICIIVATIISMTYLLKGGLKADVNTNAVQFVLMFTGFFVLVIFSINKFGMPGTLVRKLPVQHLQITGGFMANYFSMVPYSIYYFY